MPIELVYDHNDFVVVNKPMALNVHSQNQEEGILPIMCRQLNLQKLWLVHRLDKVTSGLLILAKHQSAASLLSQMFERREVQKFYLALSDNKPKKSQGVIAGDMKKIRDGKWMLTQENTSPAISQFFNTGIGNGQRLFIIKPHTGKTHQIRVALKSLGSPILGDSHYAGSRSDRTYLHAFAQRFKYMGTEISLSVQPDEGVHFNSKECKEKMKSYDAPWHLPWPKLKSKHVKDLH